MSTSTPHDIEGPGPASGVRLLVATTTHAQLCERVRERVEDLAGMYAVVLDVRADAAGVRGQVTELVELLAALATEAIEGSTPYATVALGACASADGTTTLFVDSDRKRVEVHRRGLRSPSPRVR